MTIGDSTVLLVCPIYGRTIPAIRDWLEDRRSSFGRMSIFSGNDAERAAIVKACRRHGEERVVLVFVGHGAETALLTAPNLGRESNRYGYIHGELLDQEFAMEGRLQFILAFCCYSASDFGRDVASSGGEFVGFTDEIFLPLKTGEHARNQLVFRALDLVCSKVESGEVVDASISEEMKESLKAAMDDSGDGPYGVLIRMSIESQLQEMKSYAAEGW